MGPADLSVVEIRRNKDYDIDTEVYSLLLAAHLLLDRHRKPIKKVENEQERTC
jgi:hypothetical protein